MNFMQQVKLMFIFIFQLALFPPGTWRKQKSQKRQRERYQKDLNHMWLKCLFFNIYFKKDV